MVAYSAVAHDREEYIRLPVPNGRRVSIFNASGAAIPVSLTPVLGQPDLQTAVFRVTVPALGHTTAFVTYTGGDVAPPTTEPAASALETMENEFYRLTFDAASGLIVSVTDLRTGVVTKVTEASFFLGFGFGFYVVVLAEPLSILRQAFVYLIFGFVTFA